MRNLPSGQIGSVRAGFTGNTRRRSSDSDRQSDYHRRQDGWLPSVSRHRWTLADHHLFGGTAWLTRDAIAAHATRPGPPQKFIYLSVGKPARQPRIFSLITVAEQI